MRLLRNISIKFKLISIIFSVSILAILFGFTVIIIKDIKSFKKTLVEDATVYARLIGDYCVTPLAFDDNAGAEDILKKLELLPGIMSATVFDEKGNVFSSYQVTEGESVPVLPLTGNETVTEFSGNYLHVYQPIFYQNMHYGAIYLCVSTNMLGEKISRYLVTMALLMIVLAAISYVLASRLQGIISNPIVRLTDVTRIISQDADYSIRIDMRDGARSTNDEMSILFNGFDNMLKQIHLREKERDRAEEELKRHREHLEELVKGRTSELEMKSAELEEANIKLKELDRMKSMFIATMSHELRTPLNSIIGFTGIILQGITGEINEEQRKQLTIVKNSANHLLALINDVIDVSKIEADKVTILVEEFDLSAILQSLKDSFTVTISKKGLEMPLAMPEHVLVKSDERRVKQILVNLVGNAVKFTDQGAVEITVAKENGKVEIKVKDTGIGMKEEDIDRLFKAFSRISNEGKLVEGTGLGLYLSRKLANLLGGDIRAESEYGRGSVFTLELPLVYEERQP